eukprot:jgi/Chlat1/1565/Chrsp123S01834
MATALPHPMPGDGSDEDSWEEEGEGEEGEEEVEVQGECGHLLSPATLNIFRELARDGRLRGDSHQGLVVAFDNAGLALRLARANLPSVEAAKQHILDTVVRGTAWLDEEPRGMQLITNTITHGEVDGTECAFVGSLPQCIEAISGLGRREHLWHHVDGWLDAALVLLVSAIKGKEPLFYRAPVYITPWKTIVGVRAHAIEHAA